MRAADPGTLLEIVVALLEDRVSPAVEDQQARSALWIVIGLLDNLATRVVESPDLLRGRAEPAQEMLAARPPRLRDGEPADAVDDDGRKALMAALRRLRDLGPEEWDEEERAWLDACLQAMRERTRAEVDRMRPTRYGRSFAGP